MEKETLDAIKELLSKIPREDLEKAIKELPADKLKQLSGGGWWDSVKSFFGYGKPSDQPSAPVLSPAPAQRVYSSDEEIRKAALAKEIKGRSLKKAYKSIHPHFTGSIADVEAILRVW